MSFPQFYVPANRSVCRDYDARAQLSFDYLACEGYSGWPATHVMIPFAAMMFTGNFVLAWWLAILIEPAEVLSLTLSGKGVAAGHADQLETIAGSQIGDVFNDLLGVLCALVLLRIWRLPGLLAPLHYQDVARQTAVADSDPITQAVARERALRCCGPYWWKQYGIGVAFVIAGVFPSLILPTDCDVFAQPYPCTNLGLIISVVYQLLLIVCMGAWWMRTATDNRYLWRAHGVAHGTSIVLFIEWGLFVLMVGIQNAQPIFPLWLGTLYPEWAQVWVAAGAWLVLLLAVRAIARCAGYDTTSKSAHHMV
jgi:hypothetical protein